MQIMHMIRRSTLHETKLLEHYVCTCVLAGIGACTVMCSALLCSQCILNSFIFPMSQSPGAAAGCPEEVSSS